MIIAFPVPATTDPTPDTHQLQHRLDYEAETAFDQWIRGRSKDHTVFFVRAGLSNTWELFLRRHFSNPDVRIDIQNRVVYVSGVRLRMSAWLLSHTDDLQSESVESEYSSKLFPARVVDMSTALDRWEGWWRHVEPQGEETNGGDGPDD